MYYLTFNINYLTKKEKGFEPLLTDYEPVELPLLHSIKLTEQDRIRTYVCASRRVSNSMPLTLGHLTKIIHSIGLEPIFLL